MLVTMIAVTVAALVRRFRSRERDRPVRPGPEGVVGPERRRVRRPAGPVVLPLGLGVCGAGVVTAALVLC
ncbi:hypothetical protein [Nocardia sp. NPDC003345]